MEEQFLRISQKSPGAEFKTVMRTNVGLADSLSSTFWKLNTGPVEANRNISSQMTTTNTSLRLRAQPLTVVISPRCVQEQLDEAALFMAEENSKLD